MPITDLKNQITQADVACVLFHKKHEVVKKLVWEAVDKINADAPFFRRIKKVIIRKRDFVKNTSHKIIRFTDDNKKGE